MFLKLGASASALALIAITETAHAQTKVACAGEQTTHSAHRTNDPEYPLLMGKVLDAGFSDSGKMALYGGGFVEGNGPLFAVGNFAHPQGTVLVHDLTDPKTYTKSDEYQQLRAYLPDLVVLGPFGWHETLTKVPLSNFPADYDKLIDAVQGLSSKPQIALVTPVPESGVDKADGFTEIDGYVKAMAAKRALPLIDVWTEFLGKAQLYQDDFHLNLDGRTHLAEFIGKSVKQLAEAGPPGGGGSGGSAGAGGVAGAASGGAANAGAGGVAGSAGATADGGSAGSVASTDGGHAGSAVVAGAAGSGGAMSSTGDTAGSSASPFTAAPSSSSGSCSYPVGSSASSIPLGLLLLGILLRRAATPPRRARVR